MQIFEITARKPTQEAINPGAVVGALGAKLAAYNAQQAGLSMPHDTATRSRTSNYDDARTKAAAAADPLINQMAADEMANWNRTLANAMKSTRVTTPGSLPPQVKQSLENSFMNRVYGYFLDNQLGDNPSQLPKYVDNNSQSEASILLSELNSSVLSILNFNSPASTPQGQFQQWRDLSKVTYDMRSLMQFNSANRQQAQQKMPVIVVGPGTAGSVKIGNTTLNTGTVHSGIAKIIRSFMPSPTSREPVISVDNAGNVMINGTQLNGASDPIQDELIKIIKAEVQKLNP
jgi:hypothetical protein